MTSSPPILEMRGVTRSYGGLRPLRIAGLVVSEGERVSLGGLEAGAAEAIVNLVTGASLPDAGDVRVFGRPTADIANGDEWLDSLEQFGIVSPRAVLLEGSTLLQNLAMPFTLDIDPVPTDVAERVRAMAALCGIDPERWLNVQAGALPPAVRVQTHVARALALKPRLLVVEHPTVDVDADAKRTLAASIVRACEAERVTALILTNDAAFAGLVASRRLQLDAATGAVRPLRKGWFSR